MENKNNDPVRNSPSEKGRKNDPYLRDHSGQQPGVNTMSSSDTDGLNRETTKTTSGQAGDEHADPSFEDVDHKDD